MSIFGDRLKTLRKAAGHTQQELADKANVTISAIRELEQGRNNPTWDTVLALAGALGCSCEDFKGVAGGAAEGG